MQRYSFSKAGILAMPIPVERDWILFPDSQQKHFYVRVTANGARSFVVDRNDVKRGRLRLTLGTAGTDAMTAAQARELAAIALGLYAEGYTAEQIKGRLERS